jgi:hypothetical protein
MNIEIFKDVPNFEGYYQVSNLGRVKTLERLQWREFSDRASHWAKRKGKILNPCQDKEGYLHVRLTKGNGYTLWKVHQLVALVFLGHDRKNRDFIVHHLNHNKKDNRLENLEIQQRGEHIRKHKRGQQ